MVIKMRENEPKVEYKYAKIIVEPPGPISREWQTREQKAVSHVMYHIIPEFVQDPARSKGSLVGDVDGNIYIDGLGGVSVNSIGLNHPRVVAAKREHADKGGHMGVHVAAYPQYIEMAEKLQSIMPEGLKDGRGFFGNSGTEAVEAAMKQARQVTEKLIIIASDPSFHGRTMGSLAATTGAKGRAHLEPLLVGVEHVPYPDPYRTPEGENATQRYLDGVEKIISKRKGEIAAILIETIAGEPGVIVPPKDLYPKLRKLADSYGILQINDEVQAGMGRTGRWLAIEHFGTTPDIVTMSKALGGGDPLGAILSKREIDDKWSVGSHASTFGGNLDALNSGRATIETIEKENLLESATKTGAFIFKRLKEIQEKYEIIGEVRGMGMLIGIELVKDQRTKTPATEEAKAIKSDAVKHGFISSVTGPNTSIIRLAPALNIPTDMIAEGLDILEGSFKRVTRK